MSPITLETTGETWLGTFPGLGQVAIGPDGSIDTALDTGTDVEGRTSGDTADQRHRALRHGWGIPLAQLRLGRSLIAGTALVDPAGSCLITHGPMRETTDLALRLIDRGWRLLAPRLQPVDWDGDRLIAHPTATPMIVRRRRTAATRHTGELNRVDSDCVVVDVPTHDRPAPVAAILGVRERRVGDRPFSVLTGHDRFEQCTRLLIGRAITGPRDTSGRPIPPDPAVAMATALRLARTPHASTPAVDAPARAANEPDTEQPTTDGTEAPQDDGLGPILDWWAAATANADADNTGTSISGTNNNTATDKTGAGPEHTTIERTGNEHTTAEHTGNEHHPNTVWLASFPKSGNTWMRAIITALDVHPLLFDTDHLEAGQQPHALGAAVTRFAIDPRWLDRRELDRLRTTLIADQSTRLADDDPGPIVRKTHEQYRRDDPAHEPFPTSHTRAAIFVIRDPRDVASSYASHFGLDLDAAIDSMADTVTGDERGSPFLGITAQVWGSWSEHARSWLDADLPFPVHVIRYEDLQADTVGTLAPVFDAIGFDRTRDQLAAAAERARFDRLRAAEAERGFRETGRRSDTFFRRGTSGAWRDDLTDRQIAAIEADHHEMMTRFGYEPISDPDLRHAVAEARASTRRRRLLRERIAIAPEAGITVEFGDVPETLDGGQDVGRFFHTTPTTTIAKVGPRIRMLVERGTDVTVHWPDDVPDRPAEPDTGGNLRSTADDDGIVTDQSWIVQGWAVVIAGLQRGNLSIHASTVRIGDQTVAIAGHAGAGKSTTSMGLRRRGHELLVDDTTMLEFRDRVPYVVPYARNVHLLPDAAAALGVDFDSLHLLGGGRTKAAFLPEAPDPTPRRLDRIVILRRRRSGLDAPMLVDVGPERVAALAEHADRRGLAPAILGHQRVFEQIVDLAAATKVQILVRPDGDWTLDAVLDLIEHPPTDQVTGQEADQETDE